MQNLRYFGINTLLTLLTYGLGSSSNSQIKKLINID